MCILQIIHTFKIHLDFKIVSHITNPRIFTWFILIVSNSPFKFLVWVFIILYILSVFILILYWITLTYHSSMGLLQLFALSWLCFTFSYFFYEPGYFYCVPDIILVICVEIILEKEWCYFPPERRNIISGTRRMWSWFTASPSVFLFPDMQIRRREEGAITNYCCCTWLGRQKLWSLSQILNICGLKSSNSSKEKHDRKF